MWPSEGSVSQDIVAAIAETGIEWIATDEEILSESTNGWISRDGQGHMRHPEMLYRPWRVESGDKSLHVIFRDHALSDLIGFHYQRSDPEHAAWDMISKFLAIGRAVESNNAGRGALVPVILDGENCWEYYPDGGVRFLRALYRNCIQNPQIRPQRVRDYLKDQPATDRIGTLFAGSWISHNFAIWIGHHEDNTAWDLLHQTREFLKQTEAEGKAPKEALAKAWEELFIAEGSDWFWWFGDDHSSSQDALFDELFRKHLQNVYTRLDTQPPNVLKHPIKRLQRRALHTKPTGFCPVKVDGRRTYFEWICAGHYVCGSERGTMTKVTMGVLRDVYFGFDANRLAIRIDTARLRARGSRSAGRNSHPLHRTLGHGDSHRRTQAARCQGQALPGRQAGFQSQHRAGDRPDSRAGRAVCRPGAGSGIDNSNVHRVDREKAERRSRPAGRGARDGGPLARL